MQSLAEKYRPKQWSEVIGQSKAVKQLQAMLARGGFGGRAFWIPGSSGTGKSTIAQLIAIDVADPFNVEEYGARQLTPSIIDEISRRQRLYGMGDKQGRAFIINEAHGLTKPVIERLLVLIDSGNIPAHVTWIFTTTKEGQESLFEDYDDAGPLLSRCIPVTLTNQGLASAFAARAREIAQAENLDGQPIEKYIRLAKELRNNMRAMLSTIEAGEMLAS